MIPFEELQGSPRIALSSDGAIAVRKLIVPWDQWDTLAAELYGYARDVAGSIALVEPLPFPGERPNLIVDEIEVEPFEPSSPDGRDVVTLTSGVNRYAAGALLTITYRERFDRDAPLDDAPAIPPGTFLTYSSELAGEHRTLDSNSWRWSGTSINVPSTTTINILVMTAQHTLTWHRVVRPPYEAIRNLRGQVNDATFLSCDAGTLLFGGARLRREFQIRGGSPIWRIEYRFSERRQDGGPYGWNHFYRKDADPHWAEIETADAPYQPPYGSGDFHTLFQLG